MPKFLVKLYELHIRSTEIEADNVKAAIEDVLDGGGESCEETELDSFCTLYHGHDSDGQPLPDGVAGVEEVLSKYDTSDEFYAELMESIDTAFSGWDEDEAHVAIYWFLHDFHQGQWSKEYRALCSSPYKPGACRNSVRGEGDTAEMYYDHLVALYATDHVYEDDVCPDCKHDIPDDVENGEACKNCGHVFYIQVRENDD